MPDQDVPVLDGTVQSWTEQMLKALGLQPSEQGEPLVDGLDRVDRAPDWVAQFSKNYDALFPDLSQALKARLGDTSRMRLLDAMAVEEAASGDFDAAFRDLAQLRDLVAAALADGTTDLSDVAEDVIPFAKARLNWLKARAKMESEVGRLVAAIRTACAGVPELAAVAAQADALHLELERLDDRLVDALDAIANAPDTDARAPLKRQALDVIAAYRGTLSGGFFADVDADNGFVSVSVTSTAVSALDDIA
ncbi:MAG: hypothetical protein AAFX62_15385, partial [Pseudomonadota bacterium]